MSALDPSTRLVRAADVLFSSLADDEGVLLSMTAGLYFSLNKTAVVVWDALEKVRTIGQLAQGLSDRFKVSEEQAMADVRTLVAELIARKLVVELPPAQ